MNSKDIKELKIELEKYRKENNKLLQLNVMPMKAVKRQEFLDAFEDYFRERGFVIKKRNDSVRASYDTLHFKAFSNESGELFILSGKEQIAAISIHCNGEKDLLEGQQKYFEESVNQLEKEIEREKTLSNILGNPFFYYTGTNFDIHFDSPLSILDSIFQV